MTPLYFYPNQGHINLLIVVPVGTPNMGTHTRWVKGDPYGHP